MSNGEKDRLLFKGLVARNGLDTCLVCGSSLVSCRATIEPQPFRDATMYTFFQLCVSENKERYIKELLSTDDILKSKVCDSELIALVSSLYGTSNLDLLIGVSMIDKLMARFKNSLIHKSNQKEIFMNPMHSGIILKGYADWEAVLEEQLSVIDTTAVELFTGSFSWRELTAFLTAAIKTAEILIPAAQQGEDKTKLVMAIWSHYKEKYDLIDKLDDLIDFGKIIPVIGSMIEVWDSAVMENLIEKVMIPLLVAQLFSHK